MNKSSWIDIMPPVPPVENISILIIMSLSALLFLLILVFLWHNSVKQRSVRKIENLLHNLPESSHDKNIPFQIGNVLKQCFNVVNVDHIDMLDQKNWDMFKNKLKKACFGKASLSKKELEGLLQESRFWVKQRTRKNG